MTIVATTIRLLPEESRLLWESLFERGQSTSIFSEDFNVTEYSLQLYQSHRHDRVLFLRLSLKEIEIFQQCLQYLPSDRFNTELREVVESKLVEKKREYYRKSNDR